ncbi:hypothetical protein FACS1894206_10150 [Deltaproteobacteria bacterium]|nr:hypothetical protein FACS1894206_10150 [Deltaproteobacteria bacterium]
MAETENVNGTGAADTTTPAAAEGTTLAVGSAGQNAANGTEEGAEGTTPAPAEGGAPEGNYTLPEAWAGKLWTKEGTLGEDAPAPVAENVTKQLAEDLPQFRALAEACKLTGEQANALYSLYGSVLARHGAAALDAATQKNEADAADAETVIAQTWPEKTGENLALARKGANSLGKDFADALDSAGLSASPLVLRLAHALGAALPAEDSLINPGGGGAALPIGDFAREALRNLVATPEYRSGHSDALRKAEALAQRVNLK